jgi:hypothetical protein
MPESSISASAVPTPAESASLGDFFKRTKLKLHPGLPE